MKRLIYFLIFLVYVPASAQGLQKLESGQTALTLELQTENRRVDSLRAVTENFSSQIEAEKSRENPSQKRLRQLMADALTVSQDLERHQQKAGELEKRLGQVNRELDAKYTAVLDSLQKLSNLKQYSGNRTDLDKQILEYAEKRLAISPQITGLSFDPKKIQQIDLSAAKDSLEHAIFADYLHHAQRDIDSHLEKIGKLRQEIEDVKMLREKTSDFLEEIESERDFGLLAQTNQTAGDKTFPTSNNVFTQNEQGRNLAAGSQDQSFFMLMQQINQLDSRHELSQWISPLDSSNVTLSFDDYIQLLKQAEKLLRQQRQIVSEKLKK